MKDALIWNQGGIKNVIFSKNILSIVEDSHNENCCVISVDYNEDPIEVSLPVEEVLKRLDVNV
ncbi:hypothetical protein [Aquimarina algiphila]|uniref:hypothetical protein n=1 Tax=Aquimarina algiphila TaxID=2047982 RepID=UPI00232EB2C5|nr:hypothetical protein [Aquimarina algiphila]